MLKYLLTFLFTIQAAFAGHTSESVQEDYLTWLGTNAKHFVWDAGNKLDGPWLYYAGAAYLVTVGGPIQYLARTLTEDKEPEVFPIGPFAYPKSKPVAIRPGRLGSCMAIITKKHYPGFSFRRDQMICTPLTAKSTGAAPPFFFYLAGKPDRECDYTTNAEGALNDWVLAQPDNSIDPLRIYDASLRMSRGNVWSAILTIHNLLRNNARYKYGNYHYDSNPEKARVFFNKFVDIRGDLYERGGKNKGDHQGSWYRLWGMMLFHLNMYDENIFRSSRFPCETNPPSGSIGSEIFQLANKWTAIAAGFEDEYMAKAGAGELDRDKFRVDRQGAETSDALLKQLAGNGTDLLITEESCFRDGVLERYNP